MTPAPAPPALSLICALLRGESPTWPASSDQDGIDAFLATARSHGVAPLLDVRFADGALPAIWPEVIRRACHADAISETVHELAARAETLRVVAALDRAGVRSLLMKGGGLAYSHYPRPALRPRADCDLLVAPSQRDAAWQILQSLGYRRISGPAGKYVGYQFELRHDDPRGFTHDVDLHWRISNAQSFAWFFAFEELATAAVPVLDLGACAWRLGDPHALMLALMHRAGNNQFGERGFGDRLIWLYDFQLLVEAMTDDDVERFRRLAEAKRVAAIAIDGLRRCAEAFGSPRVQTLISKLEHSPAAESGASFLRAGRFGREWLELMAIPRVGARLAYLASRVVPSVDYMRERFPDCAGHALPLLHARRWLEGIGRRLFTGKH